MPGLAAGEPGIGPRRLHRRRPADAVRSGVAGLRPGHAVVAAPARHAEGPAVVALARRVAGVDLDLPGLDAEPGAVVVEADVAAVELPAHRRLLPRRQRHALEAAQAAHR